MARAGGVARACERLHLTPQTVSGQLGAFEHALGHKLFARAGRRLELTEAGRLVLGYADQLFAVGEELEQALQHRGGGLPLLLVAVGAAMVWMGAMDLRAKKAEAGK